ncbi:MAG: NUDIX domain-containing protein [Treponema sp.]|nr:NUDIX domain-containing protein [Treponema sp.]
MEYWDLYTRDRIKLNKVLLRGDEIPEGEYHIVLNIWIINDKNEILITQRHEDKTFPLKWECTGGSIIAGEDSFTGAMREVEEEIGIKLNPENGKLIETIVRKDDIKDIYLFTENVDISKAILQENEVIDIKWVTIEEFNQMTDRDEIAEPILYDMGKLREIYRWSD